MKRVIGMAIHRTVAEVVFWEDGRLRQHGRIDLTRSGLEGFGRSLTKADEVMVEATGNQLGSRASAPPDMARILSGLSPSPVYNTASSRRLGEQSWRLPQVATAFRTIRARF